MRVRAVTRAALAAGLELAGLEVARVSDSTEAAAAVRRFAADADVGIVLVDADLHAALPRDLIARLDRRSLPVIITVPRPRWDERSEAETQILEILRQAIGYRVRAR
jgi:vacuolar-type H+-ATPase subunit F/Vma7